VHFTCFHTQGTTSLDIEHTNTGQVIYFSFTGGYIRLVPALGYLPGLQTPATYRALFLASIVTVIPSAQLAKKPGLHAKGKAPIQLW
jgi:hypothetical protein